MSDLQAWFPHDLAGPEITRITAEINEPADPTGRAIKALAVMTKNAPSYGVVVLPFAVAHQEARRALAELQALGVEEAR